jgi:hypothetical protein
MGPAVFRFGDSFQGMRRVGCSCEVPKTGFWDVGSLPEQIAEKLDFDFGWRSGSPPLR